MKFHLSVVAAVIKHGSSETEAMEESVLRGKLCLGRWAVSGLRNRKIQRIFVEVESKLAHFIKIIKEIDDALHIGTCLWI